MTTRPLDEIKEWEYIHGITPELMKTVFSKISERKYVDLMKFRENYIKKLYNIITQKLNGCNIEINIPVNETEREIFRHGIHIGVTCERLGFPIRFFIKDISNPIMNKYEDWYTNQLKNNNGIHAEKVIKDAVNQMKNDATNILSSNLITSKLLEHHYRPPEGGNEGGPGYSRTKASVTGFGPSRKLRKNRKTRKNHKARKTRKNHKARKTRKIN